MGVNPLRKLPIHVAALALCLSVFVINRAPLFYYDTGSYLKQGNAVLDLLGLGPARPVADVSPDAPPKPANAPPAADDTVIASRSAAYGIVAALALAVFGVGGGVALNLGLIWLATWFVARQTVLREGAALAVGPLAAVSLIFGCLGALPFYVAFLMPDILAPALILMIAVLCVDGRRMSRGARAAMLGLAVFAMIAHPSHVLIAVLLVPVALVIAPGKAARRWVVLIGLVAVVLGAALAGRFIVSEVAGRMLHKQVVFLPFVTARLVDDGPGLAYLQRNCPDPAYPTCALLEALSRVTDPERFDAPNILFAQTPERGSLKHLSADQQTAIAQDQLRFLGDVARADPLGVMAALARNVGTQIVYFSIDMTIPTPEMYAALTAMTDRAPASLGEGRLIGAQGPWIGALTVLHGVVYLVSAVIIVAIACGRGKLSPQTRAIAWVVLAGIVVNAVVTGGVSEPADRYGARVMLLLPMMAALLVLTVRAKRRGAA